MYAVGGFKVDFTRGFLDDLHGFASFVALRVCFVLPNVDKLYAFCILSTSIAKKNPRAPTRLQGRAGARWELLRSFHRLF